MTNQEIKAWIHALRLRTLPLALSGILMAGFIAFAQGNRNFTVMSLSLLTTLLLQILSNLANDYGDFKNGVDNIERVGPVRAVQSGIISPTQMKRAIVLVAITAFVSGLFLLFFGLQGNISLTFILFVILGIVALVAAIKYTAGANPFGYRGLGDIVVFLFFGIVTVCGTFFLLTGKCDIAIILPAISIGMLSTGVLNLNNMRDADNDKKSGKITLSVKMGEKWSKVYHLALLFTAIATLLIFLVLENKTEVLISVVIPLIPVVLHGYRVMRITEKKQLDPELKYLSLSTLFLTLWIGIWLVLQPW